MSRSASPLSVPPFVEKIICGLTDFQFDPTPVFEATPPPGSACNSVPTASVAAPDVHLKASNPLR